MFKEPRTEHKFRWKDIGNIQLGRPNLGSSTPVAVYRLMTFTLRDVLVTRYGPEEASAVFYEAGQLAGTEFALNNLDLGAELSAYISELQAKLKELEIGVLRFEEVDAEKLRFVLTIAEDLDCSGMPSSDETVCDYDEGFIAGVLGTYLKRELKVREIDCWASGGRTCRFRAEAL